MSEECVVSCRCVSRPPSTHTPHPHETPHSPFASQVKWFSPFLLAVYDRHSETFQSLCRVMSGFTDEFYAAAKARLSETIIPGPKPYYNTLESPSVWFEPTEVRVLLLRGGGL